MKKMLLSALALASVATGANAVTLVSADVRGSGGATLWTTAQTGNFTLFLAAPGAGDYLNPLDEPINFDVPDTGITAVLLSGDGFPSNSVTDSDPQYNLTLTFDGGQILTAQYVPLTNTFLGGSSFILGNTRFSLMEFSFRRDLGDAVSPNIAVPGGAGNDYNGNFRINTGVIPEPASWALMIIGFGLVGVSARRRARTTVTCA